MRSVGWIDERAKKAAGLVEEGKPKDAANVLATTLFRVITIHPEILILYSEELASNSSITPSGSVGYPTALSTETMF